MARGRVIYGPPSVERALGALPVVAAFARRLDIAGTVDRACPVRDIAHPTHGQVIEALVANRLTSPTPLVHVEDWALAETFGLSAEVLNDDRIGRALDAVAPHLERIVGSIGAHAIATFGVDVARIHWDMTSISLYGSYPSPDPDHIEARFGHPKDRRPDLKQVQAGFGVSADGGIPTWHHAYDGGAGEVAQVVPAMESFSASGAPFIDNKSQERNTTEPNTPQTPGTSLPEARNLMYNSRQFLTTSAVASWTSPNIGVLLPPAATGGLVDRSTWRVRPALQRIEHPHHPVITPHRDKEIPTAS